MCIFLEAFILALHGQLKRVGQDIITTNAMNKFGVKYKDIYPHRLFQDMPTSCHRAPIHLTKISLTSVGFVQEIYRPQYANINPYPTTPKKSGSLITPKDRI